MPLDLFIGLVMFAFVMACTSEPVWTSFGVALRNLLRNPSHARIFNGAMALLLVASIVPMMT